MKKISIGLNVVMAATIVGMAYYIYSEKKSVDSILISGKDTAYKSCFDCSSDAFYGLQLDDCMIDIARYRKTHWNAINDNPYMQTALGKNKPMKDARACWYSLDTLKKFICLIENYSLKNRYSYTSKDLGIRFYYAVYPDPLEGNPEYKSHHTLFMVPTLNEVDFDPRYSFLHGADPKNQPLDSIILNDPSEQPLILDWTTSNNFQTGFTGTMAKNQGNLCPPTCLLLPCDNGGNRTLNFIDCRYPDESFPGSGYGSNNSVNRHP